MVLPSCTYLMYTPPEQDAFGEEEEPQEPETGEIISVSGYVVSRYC